jgi:hypothetical protein
LVPPRLDRNELGALLVTTDSGRPADHALISLLALNGLRGSEATGPDTEQPKLLWPAGEGGPDWR